VRTSRLALAAAVALAACTTACSALLDWSGFTGGPGDGGAGEGGETDAATSDAPPDVASDAPPDVIVSCGNGGTCAPNAPGGWMGPVSLYVGAVAAPSCDADASSLFNGQGDLVAPAATCSNCSCGTATGVTCATPVLSIFEDTQCTKPATPQTATVSSSCSPVLALALAVTVAAPLPTGGSCAPSGGALTAPAAAWSTRAQACPISVPGSCSGGGLCVPGQPASSSVCVMKPGTETLCPPGYPSGPQVFYTGVDDTRGCSACTCGSPSGATCAIGSPAIDAFVTPPCTATPNLTLTAPSPCTALGGALFMELVSQPMVSGQGTCAVSGGGMPSGAATPTGATSFCCLP
jgi:hypothetical protein